MQLLVIIFILWRLLLFGIAWIGGYLLPFRPSFPYSEYYLISSGLPNWLWAFANFDGVHYLTIALNGYSAQFTQVFFPLYPLAIQILHGVFPFMNTIISGLFISNLFLFLSIVVFRKLIRLDYDQNTANWATLFLLIFPTSFFFGGLYTESLFLFLILGSIYCARRKKWLVASVLGACASATRLVGLFVLPVLMWEWYKIHFKYQNPDIGHDTGRFKAIRSFISVLASFMHSPLSLVLLGLLSYMLFLQINFGDFLYFWHAQPIFGAQRSGSGIILLPQVIWRYLKIFTSVPVTSETFWIPMLEFISTLSVLILLYVSYRKKIRNSYLLFSLLSIITPTLTGTFSSMPRYVLTSFPVFILLAMYKNPVKYVLSFFFTVLLIILTIMFTRGHWVG